MKFLTPVTFFLASVGALGDPVQSKWSAESVLKKVFGYNHNAGLEARFNAHYNAVEEKRVQSATDLLPFKDKQKSTEAHSDAISQHILCASATDKDRATAELFSFLNEDQFHPVYSSSKENMICYVANLSRRKLRRVSNVVFPAVAEISNFMRVHHSVMDLTSSIHTTDVGYFEVFRGFGVRGKGLISENSNHDLAKIVTDNILHERHSAAAGFVSTMSHLDKSESSGGGDHVWVKQWNHLASHLESMSPRSELFRSCGLHNVVVDATSFGLRISEIRSIDKRSECVLLLASHLAASSADIMMVLAIAQPVPLNNFARPITQIGGSALMGGLNNYTVVPGSAPYSAAGLNGLNEVIAVGDTGLDELMCFFTNGDGTKVERSTVDDPITDPSRRKVIQYIAWSDGGDSEEGHGTHVTGSVAGQDIDPSSPEAIYNGMAYSAKIAFFDLTPGDDPYIYPPSDLYNDFYAISATSGAHMSTNSWGSSSNYYDSMALQTDEYVYDNPQFLVLFAAGNDGDLGYGTIGSPAVSKNMITVGATETGHNLTKAPNSDPSNMAYFSSIGPTYDGRIKPDLCAPGYYIYSALSSNNSETGILETCDEVAFRGTSMATPVTASNAAMVRQYFSNSTFWETECRRYASATTCTAFSPSGVLIKAVLMNSGEPMERYATTGRSTTCVIPDQPLGAPPDYFQGYGRIMLSNVLPLSGTTASSFQLFVQDLLEIKENTALTYTVVVSDNSIPLSFTISWYDPPNVFWTGKAVLNDIDLIVTSPSGLQSYGNNIKGDELNNNERVLLQSPEVGTYTVTIQGKLFAYGACKNDAAKQCQNIAVVSTSSGATKYVSTANINSADYINSKERQSCNDANGNLVYVGMQTIIGYWGNSTVTISSKTSDFNTTFSPDTVAEGYDNTWYPSATNICLVDGVYNFGMSYEGDISGASIDACGAYLGKFQTDFEIKLTNGECECAGGWTTMELGASLSITWFDYYYYKIDYIGTGSISPSTWLGSLPNSDIGYYRLCLPPGLYNVSILSVDGGLNPPMPGPLGIGISLQIDACELKLNQSESSATCYIVDAAPVPSSDTTDDSLSSGEIAGIVIGTLVGAGILCLAAFFVFSKYFRPGNNDRSHSMSLL